MTLGGTRSDAQALVESLADPLAEVESVTLGDTRGHAHALVDTPADKPAVVEAVGDTRGDAHPLVDTGSHASKGGGGDSSRRMGQCALTGRTMADTLAEVEAASTSASVSERIPPLRAHFPGRHLVSQSPPLLVCQPECRPVRAHSPMCRLVSQPQPLLACQPDCQPVRAHRPVCRLLSPPLLACQPEFRPARAHRFMCRLLPPPLLARVSTSACV